MSGPTSQVSDLCRHMEPQVQKSPILCCVVNLKGPCIFTLQWSLQIMEPFLLCIADTKGKSGNGGDVLVYPSLLFCHVCLCISVDSIAAVFAIT